MRRLMMSARPDLPKRRKQLGRTNFPDRPLANAREEHLKQPLRLRHGDSRRRLSPMPQPLARYYLEGLPPRLLINLPVCTGVIQTGCERSRLLGRDMPAEGLEPPTP